MSSPPTRGCSVPHRHHWCGPAVLPADAGVFRSVAAARGFFPGPPRRRGGVPSQNPGLARARGSSPPTRGCSGLRGDVLEPSNGPPRRRGGVPGTWFAGAALAASSPPTRGCSDPRCRPRRHPAVLPADAGVLRVGARTRSSRSSPPRRRGGVPPRRTPVAETTMSSPPTRGCSGSGRCSARLHAVLPAEAGVLRAGARTRSSRSSPPRRRGGIPLTPVKLGLVPVSSPPTRGCSVASLDQDVSARVLPADAGVFRTTRSATSSTCGPPRRRGSVPHWQRDRLAVYLSSPPTWGCSGMGRDGHPVRRLLPADAGSLFWRLGVPPPTRG